MGGIRDILRKLFGKPARSAAQAKNKPFNNDSAARQRLLDRFDPQDPDLPRPLVTLEEFFEGNFDEGSIGYNLTPPPSTREIYAFFRTIREKPEVLDIRIEIEPPEEPGAWPWSDTLWIITSANADEVKQWLGEPYHADELLTGFEREIRKLEKYPLPEGMNAIGVWWD
jgi:hypothetical protein